MRQLNFIHDLVGKKFNHFTVIKSAGGKNNRLLWLCKCVCGNEEIMDRAQLTGSKSKFSCGCTMRKSEIERFKKFIFYSPDGCWLWTGSLSGPMEYASFNSENEKTGHRFSYRFFKGDIPEGMCVCHTCDVPICVNPDHLFLGTHKDNLHDMAKKGRKTILMGEQCTQTEITEKDVLRIRGLLAIGLMPNLIARCMRISKNTANSIKRGVAWKHVGYPEVCGVSDVKKKHTGYNYRAILNNRQKERYDRLFSKEPI